MTEDPLYPALFSSEAMILVADDTDDEYPPETDEGINDPTHKVQLGEKVTVTFTGGGGSEISAAVDVPVRATLNLNVTRFDVPNVRTMQAVSDSVEWLKARFAQVGLEIDVKIDEIAWPQEMVTVQQGTAREGTEGFLDLYNEPLGPLVFTDEYKSFVDIMINEANQSLLHGDGLKTMDLYFFQSAFSSVGVAITMDQLVAQTGPTHIKYSDRAFINDAVANPAYSIGTPAHELLHLFTLQAIHPQIPYNLLDAEDGAGPPLAAENSVLGRRRISADQEKEILTHPAIEIE